ncbi:unnamed protein product [Parajaminaea phylloscopi]
MPGTPARTASFNEKIDEPKLEGGNNLEETLTYGHDEIVDGPRTVADEQMTKAIMRKVDWRLLPTCAILYLFSFLDRTAIGNAKVAGMSTALRLTDTEYALCLSLFFIPYGALEVPSNLMLKRYGAKVWLPIITLFWGLTMTFTGLIQNFEGLLSMRLVLGAFEAGLFPGVSVLLSFLYPRAFIQFRIGIFFSAATIAGAFGGLLAYGLARVQVGDYAGWRWIFIVEGLLTVAAAVLGYFTLISSMDDAKFLTQEERDYMRDRLLYDGQNIPMNDNFKGKFVKAGFLDWKTWLSLIAYVGSLAPLYCIALTLPTILRVSLRYDALHSQLMTVPVYTVAAIVVLIFAWFSDKYQNRTFFLCLGCGLSAIGWGIGYATTDPKVRFAGCFISAAGSYAGFPSVVALLSQNVGGKVKRSTCIAIQVGVGGLSGIISSNIFPARHGPYFYEAYRINIGLNCAAIVGSLVNFALLYRANQKKQRMIDSGEAAKIPRAEIADMGDESPYFRYKY